MFPNYWEYPLGVLGCVAVLLWVSARERSSWWYTGRASLALLILSGAMLLTPTILAPVWGEAARLRPSIGVCAAAVLTGAAVFRYMMERHRPKKAPAPLLVRSASRIALALLPTGLVIPQKPAPYHVLPSSRNFHRPLSVLRADQETDPALPH